MASRSNWGSSREPDPRYMSKPWRALRLKILAKSTTCGICGHEGSGSVDHIEPVEMSPEKFLDPANCQPCHGVKSPCRVCAKASGYKIKGCCQELRSSLPVDQARARLKKRTGLEFGQYPGQPAPLTTTNARCPYKTVQAAITDLESTPGKADLARDDAADVWAWQEAGLLSCKCGPATGEESAACWLCNPVIRP